MDYRRHVIRSTAILFIMSIFAAGFGYITRFLLARNLTIEEFGLFYAVFAFITFLDGFTGMGMGPAVVKFIPEFRVKNDNERIRESLSFFFWVQAIIYLLIAIGIVLASNWLTQHYFKNSASNAILFILVIAFAFSIFESLFTGLFAGFNNMNAYGFVNFFRAFMILFLVWLFLTLGFHGQAPAYAYLAMYAFTPFVYLFLSRKIFPLQTIFAFPKRVEMGKKLWGFAWPTSIGIMASSVQNSIDTMILTGFRSLTEVAVYNVALPTAGLLRFLSRAIGLVILPISSELHAQKHKEFAKGIEQLLKYSFISMLPLVLLLIAFPDVILRLLFGESFVSGAATLQILALTAVVATIATINSNILQGIGQPTANTKIIVVGAIVSVIINLLLIPIYGIIGAALASFACQLVMVLLSLWKMHDHIKVNAPWIVWLKTIFAAIIFLISVNFLKVFIHTNQYLEAVIISIISGTVFLSLLLLLKVFTFEEIKVIVKKVI